MYLWALGTCIGGLSVRVLVGYRYMYLWAIGTCIGGLYVHVFVGY